MNELDLLNLLAVKYPQSLFILSILGLLVVVGQGVVVMTPSKADDAAWEKIKNIPILGKVIQGLAAFAPVQKK